MHARTLRTPPSPPCVNDSPTHVILFNQTSPHSVENNNEKKAWCERRETEIGEVLCVVRETLARNNAKKEREKYSPSPYPHKVKRKSPQGKRKKKKDRMGGCLNGIHPFLRFIHFIFCPLQSFKGGWRKKLTGYLQFYFFPPCIATGISPSNQRGCVH